jgi:hypothetical protein
MTFLLSGQNPYSAYYGNTAMAQSPDSDPHLWASLGLKENPGFSFYAYPPLTFLLSLPVYVVWKAAFGWFDERIIYLTAMAMLAFFGYRLARGSALRLPFLSLLIVNPLGSPFFLHGFNDILCITFLVMTIYALRKDTLVLSSLFLGLACGVKQFAWIMVPFYLAYLVGQAGPGRKGWRRLGDALRRSWPLWLVIGAVFLPFLVWDPMALFRGLIERKGPGEGSAYPFRAGGLGFSNLLICLQWVTSPTQRFPNTLFYIFLVLPAMSLGLWWTVRRKSVAAMLTGYFGTLFLVLYFSCYFAPNYLWLLLVIAASAFVVDREHSD